MNQNENMYNEGWTAPKKASHMPRKVNTDKRSHENKHEILSKSNEEE